uniref:Uncharacterized protein n=1 Tax=Fagus sylvatica TaxID=28930 RepID=A0A2N9EKY7_FAGSY
MGEYYRFNFVWFADEQRLLLHSGLQKTAALSDTVVADLWGIKTEEQIVRCIRKDVNARMDAKGLTSNSILDTVH